MASHSVDTAKVQTKLFIGGEFVESSTSKTFPVVNPATEELICEVHEASPADVDAAVQAAHKAFQPDAPWRTMDASARRDLMLKLADLVERDTLYLADLEALNNGKPSATHGKCYGAAYDVMLSVKCLRYYAGWADKIGGKTTDVDGAFFNMSLREPLGVCAQIIPWNFPLLMMAWKMGPVLATGCTTIIKTSEKTPLTGLAIAALVKEAGFPAGVVNVLSGFGPTTGEPLAVHPLVGKVAFTGSTAVGKHIQRLCADHVKRCTLELGGKSPMIVCEDADLDQAVAAAHAGIMLNNGQACCAGSRLFVQDTVYDAFVAKVLEHQKTVVNGDQFSGETNTGPVVDKIQFDKVLGYIEKGKAEGATLLAGGARHGDKGYFIQPTVFGGVTDDMQIGREEIFGPVQSVLKFKTIDEVVERANRTMYGLAAGVCTRDIGLALRIVKSLHAGTVWVNCYNNLDVASPFGGFKQSGNGRELGEEALSNYLETKSVYIAMDR